MHGGRLGGRGQAACGQFAGQGQRLAVVREQVDKLDKVNERYVNTTDPDSTVTRYPTGQSTPSYKNHRVLDDQHGVITAMASTVDDGQPLTALVQQHEQRTGRVAETIVADSKYGTTANFLALQQQGKTTRLAKQTGKPARTGDLFIGAI
jgi:NAD(P)-dependent dehydrogenase (short-subunit alcohol dehydrogenase family)